MPPGPKRRSGLSEGIGQADVNERSITYHHGVMSTESTDSLKWHDANKVAQMLSALGKIKAHSSEAFTEALPELLAVLKVQRQGIADVYGAVGKITRYNEATHEQFARQIDVVRTLVHAVKAQDKLIRKLYKRADSLEKKLAKQLASRTKVKKTGWFG